MELVAGTLAVVVLGRTTGSIIQVQESGLIIVVFPVASTERKTGDM